MRNTLTLVLTASLLALCGALLGVGIHGGLRLFAARRRGVA